METALKGRRQQDWLCKRRIRNQEVGCARRAKGLQLYSAWVVKPPMFCARPCLCDEREKCRRLIKPVFCLMQGRTRFQARMRRDYVRPAADGGSAKREKVHINLWAPSLDDGHPSVSPHAPCRYESLPAGRTLAVFTLNGAASRPQMIPSELLLRTVGSESAYERQSLGGPQPRMQHCAHFQGRRMCTLGPDCNFIHSKLPPPRVGESAARDATAATSTPAVAQAAPSAVAAPYGAPTPGVVPMPYGYPGYAPPPAASYYGYAPTGYTPTGYTPFPPYYAPAPYYPQPVPISVPQLVPVPRQEHVADPRDRAVRATPAAAAVPVAVDSWRLDVASAVAGRVHGADFMPSSQSSGSSVSSGIWAPPVSRAALDPGALGKAVNMAASPLHVHAGSSAEESSFVAGSANPKPRNTIPQALVPSVTPCW